MGKTSATAIGVAAVFALAGPLGADDSVVRWNALGCEGYSHRLIQLACCDQPRCEANCFSGNCTCASGPCRGLAVVIHDTPQSDLFIAGNTYYCRGGDFCPGAEGQTRMTRTSPDALSVEYRLFANAGSPQPTLHVAVFRYGGDPLAFDGLEAQTVYDLVAMGLIEFGDVLFVATLSDESTWIEETVDVSGIPQSEVVLFAAGTGLLPLNCPPGDPPEVPATGRWGLWALSAAMIAALAFRGRRAANRLDP